MYTKYGITEVILYSRSPTLKFMHYSLIILYLTALLELHNYGLVLKHCDTNVSYVTVFMLMLVGIQIWYFIFAAEITEEYTLTTKELTLFDEKVSNGIIYQSLIGSGTVTYIGLFNASNPLKVPVCDKKDFQTLIVAPVAEYSSWVLLGETSKIVKMSEQRVSKYMTADEYLIIQLHGSPQEVVTMAAIDIRNDITTENVKY